MTLDESQAAALEASVAATRTLFAAAACSVALVDDDGDALRFVASDGAGAEEIVGVTIPVGRGIAGWAAMSGQPIAVRDVRSDARFARDVAESTHYVPSSIMAAPLLTPDGEGTLDATGHLEDVADGKGAVTAVRFVEGRILISTGTMGRLVLVINVTDPAEPRRA